MKKKNLYELKLLLLLYFFDIPKYLFNEKTL